MKTTFLFCLFILLTTTVSFSQNNTKTHKIEQILLRHVVIFKFKATSSPEDIQKVADTFYALKDQVPEIVAMEWGINNSPENFNQGFTHCFVLSYKSEKDLTNYQEHPAHKAFQEVLKPHMEKVFVVDYWTK